MTTETQNDVMSDEESKEFEQAIKEYIEENKDN